MVSASPLRRAYFLPSGRLRVEALYSVPPRPLEARLAEDHGWEAGEVRGGGATLTRARMGGAPLDHGWEAGEVRARGKKEEGAVGAAHSPVRAWVVPPWAEARRTWGLPPAPATQRRGTPPLARRPPQAAAFAGFLRPLLALDPARRPSAGQMLRHPWLAAREDAGEDGGEGRGAPAQEGGAQRRGGGQQAAGAAPRGGKRV